MRTLSNLAITPWSPAAALVLLAACSSPASTTPAPQKASAKATAAAATSTPEGTLALLTALAHDSMEGRRTGSPGADRAAGMIARQMAKIGLEPAGDSGFYQKLPTPKGFNVVGVIRGSDKTLGSEHVVVGAHYDHIGMGKPVDGDSIFNGADDDASGTITVLEVARQIASGPRPRRTVVFAAFTGEESGGAGSQWYIDHPLLPLDSMVAQLQVEMIGRPDSLAGGFGKGWLTGYERSTMGDALAAAGIAIVADPYPQQSFFTRSDNIRFARRGIVAHTLSSFNLHKDYHSRSDDVSRVDAAHMAAVINAAAKAVRMLADGPKPEWKPGGRPQGR